jgi:hypothetical protein
MRNVGVLKILAVSFGRYNTIARPGSLSEEFGKVPGQAQRSQGLDSMDAKIQVNFVDPPNILYR